MCLLILGYFPSIRCAKRRLSTTINWQSMHGFTVVNDVIVVTSVGNASCTMMWPDTSVFITMTENCKQNRNHMAVPIVAVPSLRALRCIVIRRCILEWKTRCAICVGKPSQNTVDWFDIIRHTLVSYVWIALVRSFYCLVSCKWCNCSLRTDGKILYSFSFWLSNYIDWSYPKSSWSSLFCKIYYLVDMMRGFLCLYSYSRDERSVVCRVWKTVLE